MRVAAIFCLFLLLISTTACAVQRGPVREDAPPIEDVKELHQIVDKWRNREHVPGVVAGISAAHQTEIVISSGMSNLEDNIPLQADDQFRIASITKTFIAAEVLKLAGQGKLNLDELLNTYLPGTPYGEVVTVRHLLSHRSGYFDPIHDDPEFIPFLAEHMDRQWTWADMLDLAFQHELFFRPGSDYRYSNTNYMLLGLIIAEVSGMSLGEALMSDLITPLGLDHTYYATPETETGDSSLARGYITHPLTGEMVDSTSVPYKTILSTSADTMVSNVTNLLKWSRMVYGEESPVLEPELQKQMLTFDSVSPYGLGVFQFDTPIGRSYGHGGDTAGYLSLMEYLPERDLSIVILVNADAPQINLSQLRDSLLTALFPDLGDERVSELLSDLQSEDALRRRNAIIALGHSAMSSPEVISGLVGVLSLDPSSENRKEAALALGLVGRDSDAARQALTSALQDGDETVREAARLALGLMQ